MSGRERWSSLKGYVIIRVTGIGLEGWVNRVVRSGIPLRNVSRPLRDTLIVTVRRTDFPRLRKFRRRRVRYRILDRLGGAAPLRALASRRGLVLGAAACLLCLYVVSSLLLFVHVEAPQELDEQTIRSVAADAGLRPGRRLDGIDPRAVERRLHLALPEVAWANVELRGTRAFVQVARRPGWGETEPAFGHMVADRDGVVDQVVVFRGEPAVEVGQAVAQGDILIRGTAPAYPSPHESAEADGSENRGESAYDRADGYVYARVWYEEYGEAPLVTVEERPTGRREEYHVVTVGPLRWRWGAIQSAFERYVEQVEFRWAWEPGLSPRWAGPVRWETVRRQEVALTRTERDVDEALAVAAAEAQRRLRVRRKGDDPPLDYRVDVLSRGDEDGYVRVRVLMEVRENIASFQPLTPAAGEGLGKSPL